MISLGQGLRIFSLQDILGVVQCQSSLTGLIGFPEGGCVLIGVWNKGVKGRICPCPASFGVCPWAHFQAPFLPLSTSHCLSQCSPCCCEISLPSAPFRSHAAQGTASTVSFGFTFPWCVEFESVGYKFFFVFLLSRVREPGLQAGSHSCTGL